jgi:hypothetical protein
VESKSARIEIAAPIDAHSPHVIATACYCVNAITACAKIWAWHYRPCAPIPMHRQSLFGGAIAPGGPHVIAIAGNCTEIIKICAYVRTCHPRPCAPVPVQRERHTRPARRYPVGLHVAPPVPVRHKRPTWLATVIVVYTDGPNVVATAGCSVKVVVVCAWVRAWYQRPGATVPVYRQRPKGGCTK